MELQEISTVYITEWDGNDWNSRWESATALNGSPESTRVIFAKDKVLKGNYEPPKGFEDIINGEDLNGSFFSDYTIDDNDILTNHISWATYKAKWVKSEVVYHWVQTTILVKWEIPSNREAPSKIDILFINLEEAQRKHIIDNLPRTPREQFYAFTWHALFAESVIGLYVKTFWLLRDIVRPIEKKRVHTNRLLYINRQHDTARHIFHTSEVLEVAQNTLQILGDEHRRFRGEFPDLSQGKRGLVINIQQRLLRVEKEIHSLRMRAKSLTERLNNEINLAFNLATISESAIMSTIGIVSMVYLPGTFVSGIFGSNFFDFNTSSDDTWVTSGKFWVYWAVTVPLTGATLIIWAWWHGVLSKWINRIRKRITRQETTNTGGSQV